MALPGCSSSSATSSASASSSMGSRPLLLYRARIAQIAGRSEGVRYEIIILFCGECWIQGHGASLRRLRECLAEKHLAGGGLGLLTLRVNSRVNVLDRLTACRGMDSPIRLYIYVVKAINTLSKLCVDLTEEEHSMLVSAYSEYMFPRHSSLSALLPIEAEETHAAFLEETRACRKSIQAELGSFYISAIDHLKKCIIPYSVGAEKTVLYHKLEGDFCCLLGDLQHGSDGMLSFGNSLKAYEMAEALAEKNLLPSNRTRLLVACTHSLFYSYMAGCERSSEIAKVAICQALADIDTISQDLCSDSMVLLETLKEIMIISSIDFAIKTGVNVSAVSVSKSDDKLVEQTSRVISCYSTPYEQGPPAPVRRMAVPPVEQDTFVSAPSYIPAASTKDIRARRKASSCSRGQLG